jgi:hypothetical protein
MDLLVARPKAIKCSKAVISTVPQPNSSEHFDTTSADADHPRPLNNNSFASRENNQTSDLMVDFNIAELCFPDLLNSCFPDDHHNDNGISYEMMHDWTMITNPVQPNVVLDLHSLASFLDSEGEWQAE